MTFFARRTVPTATWIATLALLATLSACGQKGKLFMPVRPTPVSTAYPTAPARPADETGSASQPASASAPAALSAPAPAGQRAD